MDARNRDMTTGKPVLAGYQKTVGVAGTGLTTPGGDSTTTAPVPDPADTTSPVVTLTAPNGGEDWNCGGKNTVAWTASDDVGVMHFKIDVSTDSGGSWSEVVDWSDGGQARPVRAAANDYLWTVPDTPAATCRIRVTCRDAAGNEGSDSSQSDFTGIMNVGDVS